MGNCAFGGNVEESTAEMIRVVTSNGGVMELYPPVTAECITNGFPSHGIFRSREFLSRPLLHNEELVSGESYYLRQLGTPLSTSSVPTPYRMSVDHHNFWRRQQDVRVLPTNYGSSGSSGGIWKVNLVISPRQLAEILSQESRTEALIESVRTVAKCGGGGGSAGSVVNSDQWSLASSRKTAASELG